MRKRFAALLGVLTLGALFPGMAFAQGHIYQGSGHWAHYRRFHRDWDHRYFHHRLPATHSATPPSQATSVGAASGMSGSASQATGVVQPASGTIDGYQVVRTVQLTATAYGPSAQDNYPYGAADYFGNALVAGDVAVDSSVIPLGTWLWVQGYSFTPYLPPQGFLAHAVDEGDAIKGDRIDLYVNKPDSIVSNFGIQQVTAYILNKPAVK